MDTVSLRPRVALVAALQPGVVMERLRAALQIACCPCQGAAAARHLDLWICETERHFWSPRLDLAVEDHPGGALLRGRLGPHPDVWTLFLAGYAVSIFAGVGGTMYGLAQLTLGEPPGALLAAPAAAAMVGLIYLAAGLGQRLGAGQVAILQRFLSEALGVALEPADQGEK